MKFKNRKKLIFSDRNQIRVASGGGVWELTGRGQKRTLW